MDATWEVPALLEDATGWLAELPAVEDAPWEVEDTPALDPADATDDDPALLLAGEDVLAALEFCPLVAAVEDAPAEDAVPEPEAPTELATPEEAIPDDTTAPEDAADTAPEDALVPTDDALEDELPPLVTPTT